jgi:septum formation protein
MPSKTQARPLLLASSSPYRRELLRRLGLEFEVVAPEIDESPLPGETPQALVARLAAGKASAVAAAHHRSVVIGSDQVAVHRDRIVGKPGSPDNARRQLRAFSGEAVDFLSAVCLRCEETGFRHAETVVTAIRFRPLSDAEIDRYLAFDAPLDCAGSFRSEAGGSMLLESLESDDPTAIVGLPLIAVCHALRDAGFRLP